MESVKVPTLQNFSAARVVEIMTPNDTRVVGLHHDVRCRTRSRKPLKPLEGHSPRPQARWCLPYARHQGIEPRLQAITVAEIPKWGVVRPVWTASTTSFGRTRTSVSRSQPNELTLQRVDLCNVAAGGGGAPSPAPPKTVTPAPRCVPRPLPPP